MPSIFLGFKSPVSLFPPSALVIDIPLRIFGCSCYGHIHDKQSSKLDPKALKCMFVGYFTVKKGYKCYHPLTRKLYVTTDVIFNESEA